MIYLLILFFTLLVLLNVIAIFLLISVKAIAVNVDGSYEMLSDIEWQGRNEK